MSRKPLRILAALGVFAAAVLAGVYTAARLAPERLRVEVSRRLSEATGGPVEIESLRIVWGFPIHLAAEQVRLWPRPEGHGLSVERLSARLSAAALLAGRFRLNRLSLHGGHLLVQRLPSGEWAEPFGADVSSAVEPITEPALAPLAGAEAVAEALMAEPLLADTLRVERSRITLRGVVPPGQDGAPRDVTFVGVNGVAAYSRLRGDAKLVLHGQLSVAGVERGGLEWEIQRSAEGRMRVALAVTSLDLGALSEAIGRRDSGRRVEGRLSGFADYVTGESAGSRIRADVAVRDFEARVPVGASRPPRSVRLDRLAARFDAETDAHHVSLSEGHLSSGDLDLRVEGVLARPLGMDSRAGLSGELREIPLARIRPLLDWLPPDSGEALRQILDPVESGSLVRLQVGGADTLRGWRDLLTGTTDALPRGLHAEVELADLAAQVGDEDRIEELSLRASWVDDRLSLDDARGRFNGIPLPRLAFELEGVSQLLAARVERRLVPPGALPLPGLATLWETLRSDPDEENGSALPTTVRLEAEVLRHPLLLWPVEDLRALLEPVRQGVVLSVERGTWAGVPIRGSGSWVPVPERAVEFRLVAGAPPANAAPGRPSSPAAEVPRPGERGPAGEWGRGRFEIGRLDGGVWCHERATGRFRAERGLIHLEEVDFRLTPRGRGSGSVSLDLAQEEVVPYSLALSIEDGDLERLLGQLGHDGVAEGTLSLRGHVEGTLRPDRPLFHDVSGRVDLRAVDGIVYRRLPPIVALALASESINPFARRETLRYEHAGASFEAHWGYVSTEAFELDGPDVRVFASGGVDLAGEAHEMQAEVALFLFRQLDWAIDWIPILNVLLLGDDENMVAAYFELVGPWDDPEARARPMRTLQEGPGEVLIQGIPNVVKRGFRALGGIFRSRSDRSEESDDANGNGKQPPASIPAGS